MSKRAGAGGGTVTSSLVFDGTWVAGVGDGVPPDTSLVATWVPPYILSSSALTLSLGLLPPDGEGERDFLSCRGSSRAASEGDPSGVKDQGPPETRSDTLLPTDVRTELIRSSRILACLEASSVCWKRARREATLPRGFSRGRGLWKGRFSWVLGRGVVMRIRTWLRITLDEGDGKGQWESELGVETSLSTLISSLIPLGIRKRSSGAS